MSRPIRSTLLTLAPLGLALAVPVATAFLAAPPKAAGVDPFEGLEPDEESLLLKEETVVLRVNHTANEATVVVGAETEMRVEHAQVLDPDGNPVLRIQGGLVGRYAMQGFEIESSEIPPELLLKQYQEGRYEFAALSEDGRLLVGGADLTHDLPAVPQVTFPLESDVAVSTTPMLTWTASPNADSIEVQLEQNDSDGLSIRLPGDAQGFQVPRGFLKPGVETYFELAAFDASGNSISSEVVFTPQ